MAELFDTDVLICGVGAAGLTLAIDLARRGVSFRLIERNADPFPGSRGKGIQPRTQEVFEDLGILDRIIAVGGRYPKQRQYQLNGGYNDSDVMETTPATIAEPYHEPLLVPQFSTERVMRERLAELGQGPLYNHELAGFEDEGSAVVARLAVPGGTETIRCRWLVGADGGRSFIRQTLNINFPGKTLGVRALVADVRLTGLSRDVWHRFGEGDHQISACPLPKTDLFQLQGPAPSDGEVDLSAAGLTALFRARSGEPEVTVQEVSWASVFQMSARLAEQYRVGRVFLVGDAAHIHPPTGGQGLNTSVQDAYNLGWKLSAIIAGAPEALLDTYEQERRPVAAAMLGLSNKLLDAMKRGELRRGREAQQLDIGYTNTPLSLQLAEHEGALEAGERAPDANLRRAAGPHVRLFDLMHGPHWTLMLSGGDRDAVGPRPGLRIHSVGENGDLTDDRGEFAGTYRVRIGDGVLIRPDGYIGAVVGSQDMKTLKSYLASVGVDRIAF